MRSKAAVWRWQSTTTIVATTFRRHIKKRLISQSLPPWTRYSLFGVLVLMVFELLDFITKNSGSKWMWKRYYVLCWMCLQKFFLCLHVSDLAYSKYGVAALAHYSSARQASGRSATHWYLVHWLFESQHGALYVFLFPPLLESSSLWLGSFQYNLYQFAASPSLHVHFVWRHALDIALVPAFSVDLPDHSRLCSLSIQTSTVYVFWCHYRIIVVPITFDRDLYLTSGNQAVHVS